MRRKKMSKLNPTFPVIVTSYEIVMNDRKYLQVNIKKMGKERVEERREKMTQLNKC